MIDQFDSPRAFLKYIQEMMRGSELKVPGGDEFRAAATNKLKESANGHSVIEQWSDDPMGYVVGQLTREAQKGLRAEDKKRVMHEVAIGPLYTGNVNALIMKSLDGKYAILLDSGLLRLIHEALKLSVVRDKPHLVTYSYSTPNVKITSSDIRRMHTELFQRYREWGAVYPPLIMIDDSLQYSLGMQRHFSQLFVLCHELGHFLNGDLANDEAFSPFHGRCDLLKFDAKGSHQMELSADVAGFETVLNCTKRWHDDTDEETRKDFEKFVLLCTVMVFDCLGAISGGADSVTHPSVITRVLNLAHTFFGDEEARYWEQSYRKQNY